jgi:ribonuclease-3
MGVSSSENIRLLEKKIGYKFKKKSLIREALTHKSYAKEKTGDTVQYNERLEFLGDSVLGLVISHYLFNTYPGYTEAEFSKIKAYVVQESTLSGAASRLGIGSHLYLGKGEETSGGRKKISLLANALEALLAAIYLDGGFKNVRQFVLRTLESETKKIIKKDLLYDYKTRLQEVVQEKFRVLPKYRMHKEEGPEHMKIFEVNVFIDDEFYGTGTGRSKKEAAQKAARAGLKKLKVRK